VGIAASQPPTAACARSKILELPEYFFRNTENRLLTFLFLVLQNFARISAEEPESYAPRRTHEDDEDPDHFRIGNVHEMGATHTSRSGNTSASRPSRTRAGDSGSEDDDCVILKVFDPLPLSYAFSSMLVSADQDRQVLEHVTPLDAEVGDPPASRVRKAPEAGAGPSGAPRSKRRKVPGTGPAREKRRKTIPASSG
jgi:hypothetical protein